MKALGALKRLDFYDKQKDEGVVRVKTASGACVSLISVVVIVLLIINELKIWFKVDVVSTLSVDDSPDEIIKINFDIVFPNIECRFLGVNIVDKSGITLRNVFVNIHKHDLDVNGTEIGGSQLNEVVPIEEHLKGDEKEREKDNRRFQVDEMCLSCYEAKVKPGTCCNTCNDLTQAYQKSKLDFSNTSRFPQCGKFNESLMYVNKNRGGCNVHGSLDTNRVEGRLSIGLAAPFRINATGYDKTVQFLEDNVDLTHTIRRLSYGQELRVIHNPLDGHTVSQRKPCIFNYFTQIVPTTYQSVWGSLLSSYVTSSTSSIYTPKSLLGSSQHTNQYSASFYEKDYNLAYGNMPNIYVWYEISPMRVTLVEERQSIFTFLISVCAICGGILTIAGMLDSLLYSSQMRKKLAVLPTEGKGTGTGAVLNG